MTWAADVQNATRSCQELFEKFSKYPLIQQEIDIHNTYPLLIPDRLIEKIKQTQSSALIKQFIPSPEEETILGGFLDPIGDQKHQVVPGLIHRYQNRALLLPTNQCPIHCRYCFRKNELYDSSLKFRPNLARIWDYLQAHTEINEIILTGGDPLLLNNEHLSSLFEKIASLSHIKYLRLHTRFPVILPNRIDSGLLALLTKYSSHFSQIIFSLHINHVDEWDDQVKYAMDALPTSILKVAQTVLLKGVNNHSSDLIELCEILIQNSIRPYYLHHPDEVKGAMNFYISLPEGRRLYSELRNTLPGWAIPQYIYDIPGGEGKTQAFNPESYEVGHKFINRQGQIIHVDKKSSEV